MIRRISKNNDLKDLIKSCPSGVIDDITEIRYFISGHPETEIVATFEKVGSHLEAILPTSELSTLGNGVLMRRALYKVSDPAYPDGYYNLEFVDNLDVWLGDEETEDPFDPGYLTEGDLKTINGESLVGVGNIDVVNYIPDYYATKSWVSEQGYATASSLSSLSGEVVNISARVDMIEVRLPNDYNILATEQWVSEQGYITSIPSEYVTQSWLSSHSYMTEEDVRWILAGEGEDNPVVREELMNETISNQISYALSGYATESWVQSQGYITSAGLSGLATQSWVLDQGYITSETLPEDIATQSWVESYVYECGFAAAADVDALSRWVVSQNYTTQSWVSSQQFATQSWVSSNFLSTTALTGYATESWVSSNYVSTTTLSSYTTFTDIDSYISSFWYRATEEFYREYVPRSEVGSYLTGYATESWVSSQQFATQSWVSLQGYLTSVPSEYATQSWVSSQNFLTSTSLTGYATESWVQAQGYLTSVPSEYATQSWVEAQGYLTSHQDLSSYATQSWVSSNFLSSTALTGYATESWVEAQGYLTSHQDLSSYATQSWVSEQGYLTSVPSEYVTESWVSSQQFATQSWVSSQGYLTSHQDLSSYATKSWATSEFFEESKIWTGTQSQWEQLTSAQQALYTIALVTE